MSSQGTAFGGTGSSYTNPFAGIIAQNNSMYQPQSQNTGLLNSYSSQAPVKKLVSGDQEVHFDNTATPQNSSMVGQVRGVLSPNNPASGATPPAPTTPTTPTTPPVTTTPTTSPATTSGTPPANTGTNPPATPTNTPNGLFTGATSTLANMGSQPGTAYTNQNQATNETLQKLQELQTAQAQRTADINTSGKGLPWATGTENQLNIATAGQEQALGQEANAQSNLVGQANTQQGLQQNALGTAAGLAQTQVSPGNTLVSTLGNTPALYGLGGAGGNGASAYQNFSNLQFNTSQGQQYATQANNLTTASNQIDQNFQTLNGVATKYGMNLTNLPTLNTAQQFIMQHGGGAGDVASFNEAMNALQTSIGQIINNSGAFTPTEISSLASQMSAAALSPAQMQQLYDTVKQTAATKINTIQTQALNAEKAGTNFNNGSPASPNSVPLGGSTGGAFDY